MADNAACGFCLVAIDVDRLDDLLELLAVLTGFNCLDFGSDELNVVTIEDALFVKSHGRIECRLAPKRGQDCIRPLDSDDLLNDLWGDWLDVRCVGELRVGHDRRWVAIDEDDANAFVAQHPAGLSPRVVELACLADNDRSGSDDEHTFDVRAARHLSTPYLRIGPSHQIDKAIEQVGRIVWPGSRFGVVLD